MTGMVVLRNINSVYYFAACSPHNQTNVHFIVRVQHLVARYLRLWLGWLDRKQVCSTALSDSESLRSSSGISVCVSGTSAYQLWLTSTGSSPVLVQASSWPPTQLCIHSRRHLERTHDTTLTYWSIRLLQVGDLQCILYIFIGRKKKIVYMCIHTHIYTF